MVNAELDSLIKRKSKSAINLTEETIKENLTIIKSENYDYSSNKLNNNEDERVWIFEKINNNLNLT